jgi:hypothetical protein
MSKTFDDQFTLKGFRDLRAPIVEAIYQNLDKYPLHGTIPNISHYIRVAIIKQLHKDGVIYKPKIGGQRE